MQAIKLVTGVTPTCWRPPYGDVDVRFLIPRLPLENCDTDIFFLGVGPHSSDCPCAWSADNHMGV
jgi:hypothetical protein